MNAKQFTDELAQKHGLKFAAITVHAANSLLCMELLQSASIPSPITKAMILKTYAEFSAGSLALLSEEMGIQPEPIMEAASQLAALHQRERDGETTQ